MHSFEETRSGSAAYISQPASSFKLHQTIQSDWIATLRPRIGWIADNWMGYLTAGLAVTKIDVSQTFYDNFSATVNSSGSDTKTKLGWSAGFGGEYALDGNWFLSARYLYTNFGDSSSIGSVTNAGFPGQTSFITSGGDFDTHSAHIGLTYRFDWF